jgi:hypothetical protein
MTEMKKAGPCGCALSETMFKLRAATLRAESLAEKAKMQAREAMAELMDENPELTYVSAAAAFQNLAKVEGSHADYMAAHNAMSGILKACNTAPPGSTERR